MGEVASIRKTGRATVATLELVTHLVDECSAGVTVPAERRQRARANALAMLELTARGDDAAAFSGAATLSAIHFAAELMGSIAVDLAARPRDTDRLLESIERLAGLPRALVGRELLREQQLLELPIGIAIEVQLKLLSILSGARAMSLWTLWPGGELRALASTGGSELETPGTRHEALRLLTGEASSQRNRSSAIGIVIDRALTPAAALVARGGAREGDARLQMIRAGAPSLRTLLDAEALLARGQAPEQTVMTSVERRLARLRYDLHDGPQQDVHLLAQDLSLFREQLRPVLANDPNADRLLGRLDDVEAQLVALDGDLRRLSSAFQSPFLVPGSLPDVLRQITESFAARTGVHPETRVSGDLSNLTDSQQITLLALIREALSNVRKHSEASSVTITIAAGATGVEAQVTDDGQGFDLESTLVRAARAGRLGLVGMHERVRMLGGLTRIESRQGGPTVISATLPAWPGEEPS
jgi:signal transduction histidine kinase